ncbi:MAG TPA: translesion error-prone DNA polymerase V autoproteolytic subunit [Gammaproteobacteria bacterium]|nr:translesion error-prone DNA polymerase V autoproteolytic subunit [Gammaproteobacteria bacterium]
MGRGGARIGAGRPKGYGRYQEKTKPIRIPESMIYSVSQFIEQRGYKLPLYSSKVAAGFPSPADDDMEARIDLNELLIKHPEHTFLVRVAGESMINIGIHDKDILIVDRRIEVIHNKIVVAAIDGMLTVKRLIKTEKGKIYLMPENENFPPLEVSEKNNVHIWGVVTTVIHAVL